MTGTNKALSSLLVTQLQRTRASKPHQVRLQSMQTCINIITITKCLVINYLINISKSVFQKRVEIETK